MGTAPRTTDRIATLLAALGWAGVGLYPLLHIRSSPTPIDGGLMLLAIERMAALGWPLDDLILVHYGPAHWVLPVLAYELAGETVLGIHLLLYAMKLGAIVLAHRLVTRLADRYHAWLATAGVTLLLGLPWTFLQAPYPFLPSLLVALASAQLLLCGTQRWRLVSAALLVALAIGSKFSAGALLLAAGGFQLLLWSGDPAADGSRSSRSLTYLAAALCAAVMGLLVHDHLDLPYLLLLAPPLVLLLGWTLASPRAGVTPARLRRALLFGGTSLAAAAAILVAGVGPANVASYVADAAALIAREDYHLPLPRLGEPGLYVGFNEHFWPQLPWLVTAVQLVVVVVGVARGGLRDEARRAGLFAFFVFQLFLAYPRGDELHLFQLLPLSVVMGAVSLHALGETLPARDRRGLRIASALALALAVRSLFAWPGLDYLRGPGEWHDPRLAHLHLRRPEQVRHLRRYLWQIDGVAWDREIEAAAAYIDSLPLESPRLLLLTPRELLPFACGARRAGRHHFLFYLLRVGLLSRADFDALAPPELLPELLRDPPELVVAEPGRSPLLAVFPELEELLGRRYVLGGRFGRLLVLRLRPTR